MKLLRSLQDSVKKIEKMYADYEDIGLLIEMSEEEPDDETIERSGKIWRGFRKSLKNCGSERF